MRISSLRITFQLIFLILSCLGLFFIILGMSWSTTGLYYPYLFCPACPGHTANCPIGGLEHAFLAKDLITGLKMLVYLFGFLGVAGVLVGRWFCGWACPVGALQDVITSTPAPHIVAGLCTPPAPLDCHPYCMLHPAGPYHSAQWSMPHL